MLKKRFYKTKVKVTFEIPAEQLPEGVNVEQISVLGDFNEWNSEATPCSKAKKGEWKAVVDLELDGKYSFRYLINDEIWYNDPEADEYVQGEHGAENCVVSTSKG